MRPERPAFPDRIGDADRFQGNLLRLLAQFSAVNPKNQRRPVFPSLGHRAGHGPEGPVVTGVSERSSLQENACSDRTWQNFPRDKKTRWKPSEPSAAHAAGLITSEAAPQTLKAPPR